MHYLGQRAIDHLREQGFDVVVIPDTVLVTSPDRKRVHTFPLSRFAEWSPRELAGLRIIAAGLEVVEGLVLPETWWDDATRW